MSESLQTNKDWWDFVLSEHCEIMITSDGKQRKKIKEMRSRTKTMTNRSTPRNCPCCDDKYCYELITGGKLKKRILHGFNNIPIEEKEICINCEETK